MPRTSRPRREREERQHLPGIADIRIMADEATTQVVLDVLRAAFTTTSARAYDGGRTYLQLDAGCTAPDD
ncbi:hypothetical protein [Streptomyces prunicolor]|uniref:hypothetical protein n=1 Tax=Streptomyces prunicolor TaxID=67348 RepID=UPI0003743D5C|nr:hypothetical protein [Streptomyces prunicolor]